MCQQQEYQLQKVQMESFHFQQNLQTEHHFQLELNLCTIEYDPMWQQLSSLHHQLQQLELGSHL
jgi:hypothetical protein